jgi:hypothetical protein
MNNSTINVTWRKLRISWCKNQGGHTQGMFTQCHVDSYQVPSLPTRGGASVRQLWNFPSPPSASDLQSFGFSFVARFFAKLRVCVRDSLLVRSKICGNWERCDFLGELHRLSLHGVFGGEILLSNSCRLIRRMIPFCFAAQLLFVVGTLNLMLDEITLGLRFCGIRELRGFGWRLNSDVLFLFFKFIFSWKFVWKTCAVLWCFSFSAREFTPSWKFYRPAIFKVSNLSVFAKVLRPGLPLNPSEL